MDPLDESRRLHRRRNLLGVTALAAVLGSFGIAWPHFIRWRRAMTAANSELVVLQQAIVDRQEETRALEARILAAQRELAHP